MTNTEEGLSNTKRVVVPVRFHPDTARELKELALATEDSVAAIVRRAVKRYLKLKENR